MAQKILKSFAVGLLTLNTIGALTAGWSFMAEPSGSGLQMPVDQLEHSPFEDYFIPGLILFLVNGVYGLLVLWSVIFTSPFSPKLMIFQGILLGGWILVQMVLLRTLHPFQMAFLGIALFFLLFGIQTRQNGTQSTS